MFARQWFGPCSQLALGKEALAFETFLRKREYSKAIELATIKMSSYDDFEANKFWKRQRLRGTRLQARHSPESIISVAFKAFWTGFKPEDNEVLNVLKHAAGLVGAQIKVNSTDPDILIYSCFGDPYFGEFPAATRFLYLGENVRPDFSETDYSMTFDISGYCGRNIYVPLWLLRSKKYAPVCCDYQPYEDNELEQPRCTNEGEDAVVYIGNNSTANRIEAIKELSKLGLVVDCYGSQTRPVANKIETLKQYQYNLCFENTYTPGYVTEKIVDSFLGGAYPIYWGGALPHVFNLSEYFICDPYQSIACNMQEFLAWRCCNRGKPLAPLLKEGAFANVDRTMISSIAQILMDLF